MSAGPSAEGLEVSAPIPVSLGSVDAALTKLWKRQDVTPDSPQAVLTRACMSNLVVVCSGRERADLIARDVGEIVRRHPSRVILLVDDVLGPGRAAPVEAFVSALCHLVGDHRQVCSEVVTIRAGGDERRKLPYAARALLVGDLPTSLWWDGPEPPSLAGELFHELRPMTDQVVYSSLRWDDPVRGTLATSDWVRQSRPGDPVVVDLAWRGLRRWRQLVSQSLDPAAVPGAVEGLNDVTIEHGSHGLAQAWLLAGWLASSLGWTPAERSVVKGREMSWRFRKDRGEVGLTVRRLENVEPPVCRVRMSWRTGGRQAAFCFVPAGPGHLSASAEGFDAETRVLATLPVSEAYLVAAELQQLEPDQAFLDALGVSRTLAENLELS